MASIKQYRGKTWRAIVRRTGFPPESKTFALKKDAELWAATVEARMGVSEFDPLQVKQAKAMTVRHLFERYRDEVGITMKGRNALNILNRLIRDAPFMALKLDKVTPRNIRDWRDTRVKKIQPQSVQREMNSISGVFTYAIKEWSIALSENPCHLVSGMRGSDKPRNLRWSDEDIQTFLTAANWQEDMVPKIGRDYVGWALLLAVETAMRIGELSLPTIADFHPNERFIHLKDTKNGDQRDVPLSLVAVKYLRHLCLDRKSSEKIFPLKANTMTEYVLAVRRKCNLEHLQFHDSRHEAATRMSKKLSNVLELSAVTGHRSLKALKRYYNPTPAELASKLD